MQDMFYAGIRAEVVVKGFNFKAIKYISKEIIQMTVLQAKGLIFNETKDL